MKIVWINILCSLGWRLRNSHPTARAPTLKSRRLFRELFHLKMKWNFKFFYCSRFANMTCNDIAIHRVAVFVALHFISHRPSPGLFSSLCLAKCSWTERKLKRTFLNCSDVLGNFHSLAIVDIGPEASRALKLSHQIVDNFHHATLNFLSSGFLAKHKVWGWFKVG